MAAELFSRSLAKKSIESHEKPLHKAGGTSKQTVTALHHETKANGYEVHQHTTQK